FERTDQISDQARAPSTPANPVNAARRPQETAPQFPARDQARPPKERRAGAAFRQQEIPMPEQARRCWIALSPRARGRAAQRGFRTGNALVCWLSLMSDRLSCRFPEPFLRILLGRTCN